MSARFHGINEIRAVIDRPYSTFVAVSDFSSEEGLGTGNSPPEKAPLDLAATEKSNPFYFFVYGRS